MTLIDKHLEVGDSWGRVLLRKGTYHSVRIPLCRVSSITVLYYVLTGSFSIVRTHPFATSSNLPTFALLVLQTVVAVPDEVDT
jgi:hypothetical protein